MKEEPRSAILGRPRRRESGAALVEFAVLAPLLILLVLGIVEFGWLFGQFNDVRHGAREGGRFAAVADTADADAVAARVCQAMDGLDAGMSNIRVVLGLAENNGEAGFTAGDIGTIAVTATVDSLSGLGLIESFLPTELTSSVEFRIEQPPGWAPDTIDLTTCP